VGSSRRQLRRVLQSHSAFIAKLKRRVAPSVAYYVDARRPEFWDLIVLLETFGSATEFARAGSSADLDWSLALGAGLADEGVYSRGLLQFALVLAAELGLVEKVQDYLRFMAQLEPPRGNHAVIVAYIDYLGTGRQDAHMNWRDFSTLGWHIALAALPHRIQTFYWRSSDTFYLFRELPRTRSEEYIDACTEFVEFLEWIQESQWFGEPWMWQMGVARSRRAAHSVVGDIFLPEDMALVAAERMKRAHYRRGDKGHERGDCGGWILLGAEEYASLRLSLKKRFHPVEELQRPGSGPSPEPRNEHAPGTGPVRTALKRREMFLSRDHSHERS
jgi:hypothetical protein